MGRGIERSEEEEAVGGGMRGRSGGGGSATAVAEVEGKWKSGRRRSAHLLELQAKVDSLGLDLDLGFNEGFGRRRQKENFVRAEGRLRASIA